MIDLTIIYYTSNYLDNKNPYFLNNTKKYLKEAAGNIPIISVSHKPMDFGKNVCMGDIGRSHLNIYRQILEGCKAAETPFVAMAEDDILYSHDHFHSKYIEEEFRKQGDVFLYDMNKISLFTWTKPPIFSFRSKRKVVNQLIAPRQMLIDSLEERFARLEVLKKDILEKHPEVTDPEKHLIKYWGDPGRYEDILGVTVRRTFEIYSWVPSIVFSHEYAYGYEYNQGKKKKHGDLRIIELADWGKATDVIKLYNPNL